MDGRGVIIQTRAKRRSPEPVSGIQAGCREDHRNLPFRSSQRSRSKCLRNVERRIANNVLMTLDARSKEVMRRARAIPSSVNQVRSGGRKSMFQCLDYDRAEAAARVIDPPVESLFLEQPLTAPCGST
jgi:hypothetical protein